MKKYYQLLSLSFAFGCLLIFGAGCSKSAKAKRLISSANRDFEAKQYDNAEIKYRGVLRLSYMNPIAVRQLGLLYHAEGRPTEAYAFLHKSFQTTPGNIDVQVALAQSAASLGDAKGAAGLASEILEKSPDNEDMLMLLLDLARSPEELAAARQKVEQLPPGANPAARSAALAWADLRLNNLDGCEIEANQAIKLDPKLPAAYLALSTLSAKRGDMHGASNYLSTASDLSPLRSPTRIKYADFLFESGSPAEAQRVLEDLTGQAPDYIPALINLMHLFFAQRKYPECAAISAKILGRDAQNFEALMETGDLALAKRDGPGAIEIFKRVDANLATLHRALPIVKYYTALAYLMNGESANAIVSLNDSLALDHDYAPGTILLAELDVRAGNPAAAIKLLVPLVKKTPHEGKAHLLLATAYLAQNQPDNALGIYREMSKVFPDNPEVLRLIGDVYEQQGKVDEARKSYKQSLGLVSDYAPALNSLTVLDLASKNYDDAQTNIAAVIAKNSKEAEPWLLQGEIYWAMGKTNDAESSMNKAIELNPDLPNAYLSLARLYIDSHQTDQAMARLTELVNKTNDVTAWLEIGELHQEAGQMDAARDAYEKLLTFKPQFVPALNNLAYLYSEHYGNLDKAVDEASRAREVRPSDPYVADTLGWILYKQGQYPRALTLLQESLEKQPSDAQVQMHIGMTYYMMEDEDLARLHLQRALSSHEDYPGKSDAQACLDLLAIDPTNATPAQRQTMDARLQSNPHDPVLLSRLASMDELHGDMDKAADTYQKLITQDPQNWKAMLKLASLYSGPLHDPRKALDLAKSAHQAAPSDPHASATLGELVYTSGDYTWAVSLLEDAAPQLPNQSDVHYYLAMAYYAVGRQADADAAMNDVATSGPSQSLTDQAKQFQDFRAAAKDPSHSPLSPAQVKTVLDKDPHYLPALMLSGLLSEQQQDFKQAGQTYEQILTEFPKFTPAMRQLALIYAWHSGDDTRAYELAGKARVAYPDDMELTRTLGILAYRKAEYSRSAQLLSDSSQQYDKDGELQYYLGMDYFKLKRTQDSKKALQRALALNIPQNLADDAKKTLSTLK